MVDLSIVMGTWNRLEALQRCISACRASVGPNRTLEFIVVDGGSTDGTLAWLHTQPDVITVEQRELLGGTRAYNAGFRLAGSPLVCCINDDDEPLDDCLEKGIQYMDAHPEAGQGCFSFDGWKEGRFQWDQSFSKPYCNKGITRRHLGDRAGWWDEMFHTYAGDCELSCRIREMGYEIHKVHGCKVKDWHTDDELRRINVPAGAHPDSQLFYNCRTAVSEPGEPRRVLHLALNTPQDLQPALERALRSFGEYQQIDWQRERADLENRLIQTCQRFDPTLVFMQLQTPNVVDPGLVDKLYAPGRMWVNWSGDVREPIPAFYTHLGRAKNMVTCVTNMDWVEHFRKFDLNAHYLQIGFNQELYNPWGPAASGPPIVFQGHHYGNHRFPLAAERLQMVKFLRNRYTDLFEVYGRGWPFTTRATNHAKEVEIYRGCKITVGISQLSLKRYTSDRLHRAMGSGAFYLTKDYPGRDIEFKDGEHLVVWNTLEELAEKVDYYMAHDEEREEIARAGCTLVHRHETWLDRIHQLCDIIGVHQWR